MARYMYLLGAAWAANDNTKYPRTRLSLFQHTQNPGTHGCRVQKRCPRAPTEQVRSGNRANVQATAIAGVTNVVMQAREDLMRRVLQAMANDELFVSDLSPTQNEQLQAQVTAAILAGQHSLDAELRAINADGNNVTRAVGRIYDVLFMTLQRRIHFRLRNEDAKRQVNCRMKGQNKMVRIARQACKLFLRAVL